MGYLLMSDTQPPKSSEEAHKRVTEILSRHLVNDGVPGLDDEYNAAYHTITASTMNSIVTEVLQALNAVGVGE